MWDDTGSTFESHASEQRGELSAAEFSGEYVIVDEASMVRDSQVSVTLSSNAQQAAKALNLVNAAGSLVSNSVNVSRTPTVGPTLNLIQSNVVLQRR